jgi:hypothetical protein
VLKNNGDVKKKWIELFERLLNKKYPKEVIERILWNEGFIGLVSKEEVKVMVKAMKNKKR